MNITQVLNRLAYPKPGDNARRKATDLYDEVTIITGTTNYNLFDQTLGNLFARNKKFPISGSEIFFAFGIRLFLKTVINTVALFNSLNNFLLHSCIFVYINDRLQIQIPLIEILNFNFADTVGDTPIMFGIKQRKAGYTFFFPRS